MANSIAIPAVGRKITLKIGGPSAHGEPRTSKPDYVVSTLIDYAPEARTFANQTGHPALREPVSAIKCLHTDCYHGSLHLFVDGAAYHHWAAMESPDRRFNMNFSDV
jgi:hypothetical protein